MNNRTIGQVGYPLEIKWLENRLEELIDATDLDVKQESSVIRVLSDLMYINKTSIDELMSLTVEDCVALDRKFPDLMEQLKYEKQDLSGLSPQCKKMLLTILAKSLGLA